MNYTEKILAEFDKGFCYDRYTTEEGYKKAMYSRDQYATKRLKDFLTTSINEAIAEERARVRGMIEKRKEPTDGNGALGWWGANKALDDLLDSLDKPLTERTKL